MRARVARLTLCYSNLSLTTSLYLFKAPNVANAFLGASSLAHFPLEVHLLVTSPNQNAPLRYPSLSDQYSPIPVRLPCKLPTLGRWPITISHSFQDRIVLHLDFHGIEYKINKMSFVFSVGDFVAGAQLAYTLGKALSDSKGAAREYQELIAELNVVHKVLLQVDELRSANQLAQATVNALLFTVNSVTVTMETFIEHFSSYQDSLNPGGSGNLAKDVYRKTKWAVGMPQKVSGHQILD